jgi:hypothetical protein
MNGPSQGFDFTAAMRSLCRDMVQRLDELAHVDVERVAISLCHTRRPVPHGLYASLTPLKFEAGATERVIHGRRYAASRLCDPRGHEYLYILSFYLPRFQNLVLEEKLSTVLHELWHIGPRFDGDLRRHEGRCYAHGPSQREYDAQMDRLAQRWFALDPPGHIYEFLTHDFAGLVAEHGTVVGTRWPTPKLFPL